MTRLSEPHNKHYSFKLSTMLLCVFNQQQKIIKANVGLPLTTELKYNHFIGNVKP